MSSVDSVVSSAVEEVKSDFEKLIKNICGMYGDLIRRSVNSEHITEKIK